MTYLLVDCRKENPGNSLSFLGVINKNVTRTKI